MAEFNLFDELFNVIKYNEDDERDGLTILGTLLAMPADKFELIKNDMLNSIEASFNETSTRIALADMMNKQGVTIEELTASMDSLNKQIDDLDEPELTDSKRDFLKRIFISFLNSMNRSTGLRQSIVQIPIELCREGAQLPKYATPGSAAMDIYAPEEVTIAPGETKIVPSGLKVAIPMGYALLIQPRSGLSRKTHLRIPNTPGLIDSDYHEEIGVIIENTDPPVKDISTDDGKVGVLCGSSFTIGKGERFAQMRLVEAPLVSWCETSALGEFSNDHGAGFGSTGST